MLAYNDARVDGPDGHFGVLLKDACGQTVGGLTARWYYSSMFIEYLFVPEPLRGQGFGKRLMSEAEKFARDRALDGIWLDSYSFQAPRFYEKLGYAVFGEIRDYPPGHSRQFLSKRLDGALSA